MPTDPYPFIVFHLRLTWLEQDRMLRSVLIYTTLLVNWLTGLQGSSRQQIHIHEMMAFFRSDTVECGTDADNCAETGEDCTNTAGSFTCGCADGYEPGTPGSGCTGNFELFSFLCCNN